MVLTVRELRTKGIQIKYDIVYLERHGKKIVEYRLVPNQNLN